MRFYFQIWLSYSATDRISSSPNMGHVWNYDLARSCFLLERKIYLRHGISMNVKSRKRWPMDYRWGWWLNLGVGVVAHGQEYQSVLTASKPGDLVTKHWGSFGIGKYVVNENLLELTKVLLELFQITIYWRSIEFEINWDIVNQKILATAMDYGVIVVLGSNKRWDLWRPLLPARAQNFP